jgi:hypothetical protein
MNITIRHRGRFKNTERLFKKAAYIDNRYYAILEKYAQEGVLALQSHTPTDTGKTSDSWSYRITRSKSGMTIAWYNSNVVAGVPIAVLLQYGHGTRNGGFVRGINYINPALTPIFDKLKNATWRELDKL